MDLIPAVVQHHATGQVLMVAYMNDTAVRKTRETGIVHFWSRSRGQLWQKGETSGNLLRVVELRLDCDNDCLLVRADPAGPVCHTGNATCFFTDSDGGAPASVLDALYRLVLERKQGVGAPSYTRQLLDAGPGKIIGKIVEECGEMCAELPDGTDERVVSECADLLYHLLVGLGARNIDPSAVLAELSRRLGTSGLTEKRQRGAQADRADKRNRADKRAPTSAKATPKARPAKAPPKARTTKPSPTPRSRTRRKPTARSPRT